MHAVIFDMDGVISDTQALAAQVESELLKKHHVDHPGQWYTERYAGTPHAVMFHELLPGLSQEDILFLVEKTWTSLLEQVPNVLPVPGIHHLLETLARKGYLLAVASTSKREYVDKVLSTLDVMPFFHAIVTGDEVAKGKPSPDIFLLAAKRLGVPPEHCTVIEDGAAGMKGAKAAGMRCIGLVATPDATSKEQVPADCTVSRLEEIEQRHLL